MWMLRQKARLSNTVTLISSIKKEKKKRKGKAAVASQDGTLPLHTWDHAFNPQLCPILQKKDWGCSSVVQHMLSVHKALGSRSGAQEIEWVLCIGICLWSQLFKRISSLVPACDLKIYKQDVVVHTCNPNTLEAETAGLPGVWGQPGPHSSSLHYNARPCLKKK